MDKEEAKRVDAELASLTKEVEDLKGALRQRTQRTIYIFEACDVGYQHLIELKMLDESLSDDALKERLEMLRARVCLLHITALVTKM